MSLWESGCTVDYYRGRHVLTIQGISTGGNVPISEVSLLFYGNVLAIVLHSVLLVGEWFHMQLGFTWWCLLHSAVTQFCLGKRLTVTTGTYQDPIDLDCIVVTCT